MIQLYFLFERDRASACASSSRGEGQREGVLSRPHAQHTARCQAQSKDLNGNQMLNAQRTGAHNDITLSKKAEYTIINT